MGIACLPDRRAEFRDGVAAGDRDRAAPALPAPELPGRAASPRAPTRASCGRRWSRTCASRPANSPAPGCACCVEPINTVDVPGFLLSGSQQAVDLLREVGEHNVELQYDCYHMRVMGDDLLPALTRPGSAHRPHPDRRRPRPPRAGQRRDPLPPPVPAPRSARLRRLGGRRIPPLAPHRGDLRLEERQRSRLKRGNVPPCRPCCDPPSACSSSGCRWLGCRLAAATASSPSSPPTGPPGGPAGRAARRGEGHAGRDRRRAPRRRMVEKLAGFGTRHTLSDTTSPTRGIGAARSWIEAELRRYASEPGARKERRWWSRRDGHRQAADGRRIPQEVEIVNVVAELPGTMPEARNRRYYVIGHYDSRVNDAMDATERRARRQRRRLGRGGGDGAGAGHVPPPLRRHPGVHGHRRRGAGPVRRPPARRRRPGRRSRRAGGAQQRHRRRPQLAPGRAPQPADPGVLRGPARSRPAPRRWPSCARRGRRTTRSSRQLARAIAEVAAWHATEVRPLLVFRRDRFLRGGDHTPFNELGVPAVRFTVVDENYDRQHQNVRSENGKQYGDLPQFVDASYLRGVARLNAAALAHLANAPSAPPDPRILTDRAQREDGAALVALTRTRRGRLRGGLARDDQPLLAIRAQRRLGHRGHPGPQQGQLDLRGPRLRPGGLPQPGRLPRAGRN